MNGFVFVFAINAGTMMCNYLEILWKQEKVMCYVVQI